MRKTVHLLIGLLFTQLTFAQSEHAAYTSTGRAGVATTFESDYHAIGINPANLGFHQKYEDKSLTIGLFEIAGSIYSEALTKDVLWGEVITFKDVDRQFTTEEKIAAAQAFTDADLALNFDMTHIGLSYFNEQAGGFGFTVRDRLQWYSSFNDEFSNILFLGYQYQYFNQLQIEYADGSIQTVDDAEQFWNDMTEEERQALIDSASSIQGFATEPLLFSKLFEGTRVSLSWYREYNLSWGREFAINDQIEIGTGLGLKYVQGYGIADINIQKGSPLEAYSAVSSVIPIDYGEDANLNPSLDTVNNGSYLFPEPAGKGVGMDFGLNFIYDNKFKVGIAINDIGSITWKGNVFTVEDDTLFDIQSGGFDNYNIFNQASDIQADEGAFLWEGEKAKKVSLPTVFRGGASYIFYNAEDRSIAEVGVDVVVPFNNIAGNIRRPQLGIGGDYRPMKFIDISSGFTLGGNYGFNIPLGVDFIVNEGTYEFGFATRDIKYFMSKKSPNLSMGMGFLRFRF